MSSSGRSSYPSFRRSEISANEKRSKASRSAFPEVFFRYGYTFRFNSFLRSNP